MLCCLVLVPRSTISYCIRSLKLVNLYCLVVPPVGVWHKNITLTRKFLLKCDPLAWVTFFAFHQFAWIDHNLIQIPALPAFCSWTWRQKEYPFAWVSYSVFFLLLLLGGILTSYFFINWKAITLLLVVCLIIINLFMSHSLYWKDLHTVDI